MQPFSYRAPASLDETRSLMAEWGDEAKLIAGGTALVILLKQELVNPTYLVDLRHLAPELTYVREEDGGVRLGGLTTLRTLETSDTVRQRLPALAETLHHVATMRIRNAATIGGNVAHGDPALDAPATLIALDGSVNVTSQSGERSLPLDGFYLDYYETQLQPDEVVHDVWIPLAPPHTGATYLKYLSRTEDDYATVGVAARLTLDDNGERCEDVRLALSAAGSTVIRARAAEDALRGQPATVEAFRAAAAAVRDEVDPISDIRGSSEYKRDMAEVFVRRALEQAAARARNGAGKETTTR